MQIKQVLYLNFSSLSRAARLGLLGDSDEPDLVLRDILRLGDLDLDRDLDLMDLLLGPSLSGDSEPRDFVRFLRGELD